MLFTQFLWLLLVSAIWGASHTLIRIAVPEWGSALTTFLRIGIAAVTLTLLVRGMHKTLRLRENFREYFIVAVTNASFPIFLFAYAARTLPASYLVILNATTPIFNAVFSSLFLKDPFTLKKIIGILLGMSGIVLLEQQGTILHVGSEEWIAIGCALFASACYGISAVYLKGLKKKIDPTALTASTSIMGALFMLPFAINGDWHFTWGPALPAILLLGILGSGFAFVIYYRLLQEIGAFRASLTTFLMPIFGLFWGWLFLDERANLPMFIGVGLIISSTALFLKK